MVYGGTGQAARNWEAYHAIVAIAEELANDETLLVQSGKPMGIFRTHEYAPRVLIAIPTWWAIGPIGKSSTNWIAPA